MTLESSRKAFEKAIAEFTPIYNAAVKLAEQSFKEAVQKASASLDSSLTPSRDAYLFALEQEKVGGEKDAK